MNLFIQETGKLLRLTKADPKSLAAGIIAPTIILIIFALTFGNFASLKLAVVNDDAGEVGAAFQEAVFSQASPLSGEPYFEAVESDAATAQELYEEGRVNGVLTIPEDFSERFASGDPAQVSYAFDNYNTDMAKNLRLYLDEGIFAFYQEHMLGMEVRVGREYAVGAQLDWFAIIAVGVFVLAFLMGSMFNFLYLLNKERVYATLSEYRLAPSSLAPTFAARIVVALLAGSAGAAVNAALVWMLAGVNLASCMRTVLPVLAVLGLAFVSFSAVVSLTVRKFSGAAMLSHGDRRGGVVPVGGHHLGEVRDRGAARRGARAPLELRALADPRGGLRRRPERRRAAGGRQGVAGHGGVRRRVRNGRVVRLPQAPGRRAVGRRDVGSRTEKLILSTGNALYDNLMLTISAV